MWQRSDRMNCSKCGAQIPDGSRFCEKCGYKIEQEVEQEVAGKAVIDAERDKVAEPEPAPAAKRMQDPVRLRNSRFMTGKNH